MKKAIIILMALCLYSNIKAQEIKKVAVISIAANENLKSTMSNLGLVGDVMDATKSEFLSKDAIVEFRNFIFNEFQKEFPFELMDENVVLNHETYKKLMKENENKLVTVINPEPMVGPEGYDLNPVTSKEELKAYAEAYPETQAFLYLTLDIHITADKMIGTTGTAIVSTSAQIRLFNPEMRELLNRSVTGYSKGKFKVVAGQIVKGNENKAAYMKEALEDMYNKFPSQYASMLKNYNKKVKKYYQ